MQPKCVHCGVRQQQRNKRRLCMRCYTDRGVRTLYPRNGGRTEYGEPTQEELDRIVAEQMQCLPAWWPKDGQKDTDE